MVFWGAVGRQGPGAELPIEAGPNALIQMGDWCGSVFLTATRDEREPGRVFWQLCELIRLCSTGRAGASGCGIADLNGGG